MGDVFTWCWRRNGAVISAYYILHFRPVVAGLLLLSASAIEAEESPAEVIGMLPPGFAVLASAKSAVGTRTFYFVVLRSRSEASSHRYLTLAGPAPDRPLLIFERRSNGRYVLAGRNDKVVATADGAGLRGQGCDPFEDGHIAFKGPFFTVENGVACGGAHWTDFITFRFEPRVGGYVFDNERFQSMKLNPSDEPDADVLIRDFGRVRRAPKGRFIALSDWRPSKR